MDLSVPAIESAARLAAATAGSRRTRSTPRPPFGTVVGSLPAERFPDGLPEPRAPPSRRCGTPRARCSPRSSPRPA
ncbi:hypothetical protein IU11_14985 [Cellulosimicrobium sp. MM]|nr:hypothetical protein IU11_14985 [Cellulosimicrobium sp. MM]